MQEFIDPIFISLKVATCASLINLIFGLFFGYVLARSKFPGKELLDTTLTLPMVLPPTVLGYYLLAVLGRNSGLGKFLEDWFGIDLIFTLPGAVIAAAIVAFPLVLRPARTAFESVQFQYEQAARTLGVTELGVFFRITLPLAWRGIAGGFLLAFVRSLGEFGATMMVAGSIPGKTQTVSLAIYEAVQSGREDTALVFVSVISLLCFFILFCAKRVSSTYTHELNQTKT